ncbi:glycoside hydrolase family 43 protein [Mucilaginibacter psychrotolerans]|uniref:Glycosyl hydrolase 43 family protein n=1 Tax=Mucilaginibacter psychrotolerans TaxID=1524096 RepID=A0A4Y8SFK6_9SPHI|nr:glycoside hydrolase 43 family protein [Mucilaginibacter psychrotolerans]TFF37799.1 glycosyl hydrolase 43 family protein [Mucilaginibacter psychrotolerans]
MNLTFKSDTNLQKTSGAGRKLSQFRSSPQRHILLICFFICLYHSGFGQASGLVKNRWGDQGDRTYKNPILNGDYSDPDVIRVGNAYYMVCSDFHFMGMPILKSTDLVNWKIIAQVYSRLDASPKYNSMERYGGGSWAPSIRYHDGRFYVYFCTPDEGLFMTWAKDPAGPWSPLITVKSVSGWEDPCPFWDEDGNAYLGHSRLGAGPIIIHRMSIDGRNLLDSGKIVYEGPVAEGTKIYKRKGKYYIIIPEGGVATGYETALRASNIYGPYERKVVLEQGKTHVNGPHQGGWVETPKGESWFLHFQDAGAIGRITHLEPVKWVDDWPVIGIDNDGNGIGEPVSVFEKPKTGGKNFAGQPQNSDEFNSSKLGLQWQWNHNPVDSNWSLQDGNLVLTSMNARDNKNAKNTLTQKLMGQQGVITTLLHTDKMESGQKAGLCLLGNYIHEIGVVKTGNSMRLYADNNGKSAIGPELNQNRIWLRILVDLSTKVTELRYSLNGSDFTGIGENCVLSDYNYWKAVRPGLFSYHTDGKSGKAKFDWFHYSNDGPENIRSTNYRKQ